MDKWYARKIEVRDVLVSCLVAGGLSATLSWLIFAWVGGTEKFPWGSLGDWAAAIGTWVIGYGAWKYAREAHRLREREIKRETDRDSYLHAGRVAAIKEWARLLQHPHEVIRAAIEREGKELSTGFAQGYTRGLQEIMKMIPLDDEAWRYLAKSDVWLKLHITTYIVLVLGEGDKLLERSVDVDEDVPISQVKHSRWPDICENAKSLSDLGDKLSAAADAIPEI